MWEYRSTEELYHFGVKGMKWGVRRARNNVSVGSGSRGRAQANTKNQLTPEQKAARRKKALKIGAAVVGTALAAYGTYKLASYMQNKRNLAAMNKARDYIDNNIFKNVGKSTFADGTVRFDYANKAGSEIVLKGSRNQIGKALGQHNAKTIATGRQIYKDATNTRIDRGLAKVVNAGNAVGNTTKRATTSIGNAAKRTATKAKNAVLDVVNPVYEYSPGSTRSKTRTINGVKVTESLTDYYRRKKRR